MKKSSLSGLVILFLWVWGLPAEARQQIRIACIGNSITYGHGLPDPRTDSYPAQLQALLGSGYEVINFGVSSKTVIRNCDNAYMATAQYQQALKSRPDLVFIKLGTNDSRLPYRLQVNSFVADYKVLIRSFQALPSRPRIVLLLPVSSYLQDTTRQTDAMISRLIIPRIRQVAFEEKLEILDLHALTEDRQAWYPDRLHPNLPGATAIARRLYELVVSKAEKKESDIFRQLKAPYQVSSFYGYDCAEFDFQGRQCKVVKPRRVAAGKPWIWRARFWGVEPQTDIALLDRGFHLVYCDAAELFGNAQAISLWNDFYACMRKAGLARKTVLEGFSRGGVYVYNWAAANPGKVAAVYADAPVLDLKSWPGGKGASRGSAADWEKVKQDYGLGSEEAAQDFRGSPLDQVTAIVKGCFPMLHVVGDADEVVPVGENTALFEKQVQALGGHIKVIGKAGVGHHPHSLANPQPIVDFILQATGKQVAFPSL